MGQKIVVVEDEPSIADNITYALGTEGYETVWCPTGREGLAAVREGGVDLVILDVGLPDGSGFDRCREIRAVSDVPVIFLTVRAGEVDRVVGLEIGADDYMVKPFSPRELTARVRAVLRRARGAAPVAAAPPPEGALPFVVNEERFSISYHGASLPLSRTEYKILKALVRRPGWIHSREKLMEMAWDAPACSLERTVDAHIKSLRAKLRAVKPGDDPIVTHRGFGYSIRV